MEWPLLLRASGKACSRDRQEAYEQKKEGSLLPSPRIAPLNKSSRTGIVRARQIMTAPTAGTLGRGKNSPLRFPRPTGSCFHSWHSFSLLIHVRGCVQATYLARFQLSVRHVQPIFRLGVSGMFPAPSLTVSRLRVLHGYRPRNRSQAAPLKRSSVHVPLSLYDNASLNHRSSARIAPLV